METRRDLCGAFLSVVLIVCGGRPRLGEAGLPPPAAGIFVEAEELDGPWKLQTNYPGFSGWGFRVSNARGVASSSLTSTFRLERPRRVTVWARGLASPDQDRSLSVQVGATRFAAVLRLAPSTGFQWERCGEADLPAGEVEIVIRDEGPGYECPDALFFAFDPTAPPPGAGGGPSPGDGPPVDGPSGASLARLLDLHCSDDRARRAAIAGREVWEARRVWLAPRVIGALGLDPPPPPSALEARTTGTLQRDGYRIEKVVFESRPGMPVPSSLYLPSGHRAPPPPWPAVLCPVGHWGLSKAEPVVQARAASFARLGLAAFVIDALGQGERAVPGNEHSHAALAALAGESNMTYMLWDSIRALDYLGTRGEIDAARLGVTGCSGGGLNTLYLLAVEGRLDAAVPVGYVCTFTSFLETGISHCPCSHVPGMARLTDMGEVAALFAPKPLLVIGGKRDPMFTEAGTRGAFEEIDRLYALSDGASPELFFDDCGHDYSRAMRERAYGFFLKALCGRGNGAPVAEPLFDEPASEEVLAEGGWSPERPEDLHVFPEGRIPTGSATYRRCVEERLEKRRGQPPAHVSDCVKRRVEELAAGLSGERFRSRRLAVPGSLPSSRRLVAIDDAGITALTDAHLRTLLSAGGREAVAVEPPLWAEVGREKHLAFTNGLLVGRPLAAIWIGAILEEVKRGPEEVILVARGPAAATVALLSAIVAGERVAGLAAVNAPSRWSDLLDPAVDRPGGILPGAGVCGDIPDLLRAVRPCRVLWTGRDLGDAAPEGVEVRPECAPPADVIAWLGGAGIR